MEHQIDIKQTVPLNVSQMQFNLKIIVCLPHIASINKINEAHSLRLPLYDA